MNSVLIELLGTSFSIKSDESPDYIRGLLDVIEANIRIVQAQTQSDDPLKLAILASLMLADELRSRSESSTPASPQRPPRPALDLGLEEAERIALRLMSAIDERLPS